MARKWIIQDDEFRMGNVEMHCDLASKNLGTVKGGGFWIINKVEKIVYLFGRSIDYGKCTLAEVGSVFESGFVTQFSLEDYKVMFYIGPHDYFDLDDVDNWVTIKSHEDKIND
jgi:hypothetical protein